VSTANIASASLAYSNPNPNSKVDGDAVAYEPALEQDIFRDVFEELGDDGDGEEI